jgi:hypothetical protein
VDDVLMSMPGIEMGLAVARRMMRALARPVFLRGALAEFFRATLVLALDLGFVAGLAGIFIPGIGMPAMLWPAAMPGNIATAAAAASHLILIIGYLRGIGEA